MSNTKAKEPDFAATRGYWFGWAVGRRRKALGLTAIELSRRTADLGYPITRSTIAKIESNLRSGKVDLAEILVLAAALDVPPVLLIFPKYGAGDGLTTVIPDYPAREGDAIRWMCGDLAFPQRYDVEVGRLGGDPRPPNAGVRLLESEAELEKAVEQRDVLWQRLEDARRNRRDDVTALDDMVTKAAERVVKFGEQQRQAIESLWGRGLDFHDPENDSRGMDDTQ